MRDGGGAAASRGLIAKVADRTSGDRISRGGFKDSMKFEQWSDEISADLTAAGFRVEKYNGFPLVKRPDTMHETVRLLKFQCRYAVIRRIYDVGMIFLPDGTR